MARNTQPTPTQIAQFCSDTAYEMGSAAAVYKFAAAIAPEDRKLAEQLMNRLTPNHVQMLQELGNAGMKLGG